MKNLKTKLELWQSEDQTYQTKARVEDTLIERDKLKINLVESETENSLKLAIDMIPSNIEILKKQLHEAGVGETKETDSKGRFNLGVDHANEEKTVIVLES